MAQTPRKLYRLPEGGFIAGVANGFAHYFAMDVTLMRLIFIGAAIVTQGAGIVAYLVLAVIMPTSKASEKNSVSEKIENLAEEVRTSGRMYTFGNYMGIGIILLGVWLLIGQFVPGWAQIQWSIVWPSMIIIIGILIMTRSKKS